MHIYALINPNTTSLPPGNQGPWVAAIFMGARQFGGGWHGESKKRQLVYKLNDPFMSRPETEKTYVIRCTWQCYVMPRMLWENPGCFHCQFSRPQVVLEYLPVQVEFVILHGQILNGKHNPYMYEQFFVLTKSEYMLLSRAAQNWSVYRTLPGYWATSISNENCT